MKFDRRTMIAGGLATLAGAPAFAQRRPAPSSWFDRAIIIDALGGTGDPYAPDDWMRMSDRAWAETVATGVTVVRDTVMPVGNTADNWGDFKSNIDSRRQLFAANPDRLILIRSSADILRAKRERKFGVVLGTQDTSMVGPVLDRLAEMKKDGVMTVQLTYNLRNLSGDGSLEPANSGLSNLGRDTIRRIEAEKMLLDLSHGGARTIEEAIAFAKRPLVISHTGSRALMEHPRNTSDASMKAVAEKGGVVGVYFMPYLRADMHPAGADVIAHVEHVAKVVGEDHVGIGTDNGVLPTNMDAASKKRMDDWQRERIRLGIAAPGEAVGVYPYLADYNSVDRYRRFAADLQKRGWSQARLEKLMGGNFLRVYRDAWGA
jgi:membrane dipeptidase